MAGSRFDIGGLQFKEIVRDKTDNVYIDYGLKWVEENYTVCGAQKVTRYLALTMKHHGWPNDDYLLQVHLSWNRNEGTTLMHPSTVSVCCILILL